MRIVSLACSNTEIVCALGCAHLLVGVDDHSDYPEEVVERLSRVGPDLDIDVERVAALEPDLVLATLTVPGHERVVERLEEAGLPYVAPEPVSLGDVYADIRWIASLLASAEPEAPERAEAIIREMQREIGTDAEGRPLEPPPEDAPSVLIQWWPKPVITPGRRSWATDVLEAVGARAALGHEDHKSRPVPDDEVARLAPDAVVLSWCGVKTEKYRPDVVLRNPAWAHLSFVREGRVFCVGEPFLGRPGPRLAEGARQLREVVRRITEEARRVEA